MPSPWRSFVRSFSTLALLVLALSGAAAPLVAQAVEESRADGLLIDGGLFRLDYAYAYLFREGEGESAKDYTMVVVADRPIDEREVRSEEGSLTQDELKQALALQSRSGQRQLLGEVLTQMGLVDGTVLLRAVARSRGVEFVEEPSTVFEAGAMALVPESIRKEHRVCPLYLAGTELVRIAERVFE